ncbi:DUF2330 domain-containing protein [Polyangium spumosum]|uniref:DUF2330 domain-containing protein n=1 Tax=Polyangium spumosum TaxID=889282 RepID=A0A6N7Q071_9BACT|nr:DUF2330 domain-containing protein [Polyangium spumosum]MRG97643.1 DUF2330 domain-containing protein [Polyangium spumosum]
MRAAGVFAWAFSTSMVLTSPADAFPGFYVGRAEAKLESGAASVVLARSGTRTVVSMQNDYAGPAEAFVMVVPVPVVLSADAVKTLPKGLFERLDVISAPRLVESWQQDPCTYADITSGLAFAPSGEGPPPDVGLVGAGMQGRRVEVEAKFTVGEYDVVILGAEDPRGLDAWLVDHGYPLPRDAAQALRPYVEAGMKFFVAKVDASKIDLRDGRAVLSPLRFEYDEETLRLPARLGFVNAAGAQDLVVHVLAQDRYEVANHRNVTIPTNIEVEEAARARFGEFYAALFDATLEKNPGVIVTEYAWDTGSCDPCPGPVLSAEEQRLLGAPPGMLVHTRLHAHYGKDELGEDLVFRVAPPIQGGRGGEGQAAVPAEVSTFQGRYILRHRWQGPVTCPNPDYDIWGGPPSGDRASVKVAAGPFDVTRGEVDLSTMVLDSVPAAGIVAAPRPEPVGAGRRFLLGLGLGAGAGLFGTIGVVLAATRSRRGLRRNAQ